MPRASSRRTKADRTEATGSAGPGAPPRARWLDRPSIATAPVMPELRNVGAHVGAVVGPPAYVSSTKSVTRRVPRPLRAVATWSARSPRPARPATASGSPLPGASSESPPATRTIWSGVSPSRTTVRSVSSGAKTRPMAAADSSFVVEAGMRRSSPRWSSSTSPLCPSRTTSAESRSAGSARTGASARSMPAVVGAAAAPASAGSGTSTEVGSVGCGTTGSVRVATSRWARAAAVDAASAHRARRRRRRGRHTPAGSSRPTTPRPCRRSGGDRAAPGSRSSRHGASPPSVVRRCFAQGRPC